MDVIAVMDLALLVVAACMAIIAWQDWTQRRIANWAVLVLFGCAALRWNLTSPSVSELMFNVIIALLISVPGLRHWAPAMSNCCLHLRRSGQLTPISKRSALAW